MQLKFQILYEESNDAQLKWPYIYYLTKYAMFVYFCWIQFRDIDLWASLDVTLYHIVQDIMNT